MSAPKHRTAQPRHILADQAARLHADGLNGLQIAAQLNISKSYACELLTDPTGDRSRERKERYAGTCTECGAKTSYTVGGYSELCLPCANDARLVWTTDAIICAIQEWADDHGGIPPTATQWRAPGARRGVYPCLTRVQGRFGSWNAAIVAAGFEPHPAGPVGGYTALTMAQRRECVRRYSAGESSTAIASDLGCAPTIVLKWARRAGVPIRPPAFRKVAA